MGSEYLRELILENQKILEETEFVPREKALRPVRQKPLIITGPRRAGKSTFMSQILSGVPTKAERTGFFAFNFVDERLRPLDSKVLGALEDSFYDLYPAQQDRPTHWFLDEIQLVPDWEYFVERLSRDKSNHVYVTGSSATLLSREIASSLRGRPLAYELFPFSFREYVAYHKAPLKPRTAADRRVVQLLFRRYLEEGGFPETFGVDRMIQHQILSEYYRSMLTRDLIERHNPRESQTLEYCLKSFFNMSGRTLSFNKLSNNLRSRGIRVSVPGISEYLDWALDTYYLFSIPIYSDSAQKQRVNPVKIYAIDNGLLLATTLGARKNLGLLLENAVFVFLRSLGLNVFYGKTKSGTEVDFVFRSPESGDLQMLQVCFDISDETTFEREVRALRDLALEYGVRLGTIVTLDAEKSVTIDGIEIQIVPAWKFMLERRAERV